MRSARILGTSVAAAMLVLAACSSDDGDSTEPAADGTEAAEAEEEEEAPPGDLRLWINGPDTPESMREWLVETFAEQNPGSTLTIEEQQWEGLVNRLTTALGSATESPDVVEVGNSQSATFTNVGAFSDITDLVPELGGDDLLPGFVEAGSVDEATYAVPLYAGSGYVFYRTDLFDDLGLEVPTTMDEFVDTAITLKQSSDDANFSGFWLPGQDWRAASAFVWDAGGDLAVKGDDGQWVGALSTPESQAGLELAQRLFQEASGAPVDQNEADAVAPMCNDQVGMMLRASWFMGLFEENCPEIAENLGVFALPGSDGEPAPVLLGGSNIGISANSQQQELSRNLLRLILSDEFQSQYAENGLTPAKESLHSGLGDDEFAQASIAAVSNAKLTPPAEAWATVEGARILEDLMVEIASGGDIAQLTEGADAAIAEQLN